MKKLILSSITILLSIPCFSQSITGTISYGTEKVPNALIYTKHSEELPVYSDTNGFFELKNTKANDTLVVKSIGFEDKEIPLSVNKAPLNIELEQTSTMLNEIIIQAINSEWTSFLKRAKSNHWMTVSRNLGNINILTKFEAKEDIRLNGIAFIAKNEMEIYHQMKLRPLIFKHFITLENSLIQSESMVFTFPKNNKDNKKTNDYRIEFVFDHIIEIKKGETLYIGFEKQSQNQTNNQTITLAPVKNFKHNDLTTYLFLDLFQNLNKEIDFTSEILSDLYFELKTVK